MATQEAADGRAEEQNQDEQEFTAEEAATLSELEKKHRRVRGIKIDGHGMLVFRTATRKQWRKYQTDRADPRTDSAVVEENLQRECLVHPDSAALDRVLDDYPGLATVFSHTIAVLSGGDDDQVKILGKDWKRPVATT